MARNISGILPLVAKRFQRAVNLEIFSDSAGKACLRFPGFKYDDFNRAGLLDILRLNRLAEIGRTDGSKFLSLEAHGVFMLMFGRHWTFQPALFDRAAVEYPMILRASISAVGRSSLDVWQTLEDEADNTVLASLAFRIVNIDPVQRGAAVPLPDDMRAACQKHLSPDGGKFPKVSVPNAVPKGSFSCPIRVRFDDMDFLFHTNQGSYLGYALECAAQAAESGYYSRIREDVAFWRPRSATSIYLTESHAGDELEVSTWQDASNELLLHFTVSKKGRIIYYSQVEYHNR